MFVIAEVSHKPMHEARRENTPALWGINYPECLS